MQAFLRGSGKRLPRKSQQMNRRHSRTILQVPNPVCDAPDPNIPIAEQLCAGVIEVKTKPHFRQFLRLLSFCRP